MQQFARLLGCMRDGESLGVLGVMVTSPPGANMPNRGHRGVMVPTAGNLPGFIAVISSIVRHGSRVLTRRQQCFMGSRYSTRTGVRGCHRVRDRPRVPLSARPAMSCASRHAGVPFLLSPCSRLATGGSGLPHPSPSPRAVISLRLRRLDLHPLLRAGTTHSLTRPCAPESR